MQELFKVDLLTKQYGKGLNKVQALQESTFVIKKNDIISISGSSGAGKSTLLNLLSGLDRANGGEITFKGIKFSSLDNSKLTELRLNEFGFIFQNFSLISSMSVRDNIYLPSIVKNGKVDEKLFNILIEQLGLSERLNHLPEQLSGGEKQRVAIARALITSPTVVFADEPTGNLDSKNSDKVFELLFDLVKKLDQTLIYVTHEQEKAAIASRRFVIKDGILSEEL